MIKITEITPNSLKCGIGACPSIFETDRGTYIVIGKKSADVLIDPIVASKVGDDEFAVEIPKDLLKELNNR